MQKYEIFLPFSRYFFKLENPDVKLPKIIGFNDPDIIKGNHEDSYHIHMVRINSNFWINQLLLKNYLKIIIKQKKNENVKKSFAKIEWNNINEYAEAKSHCISKLLEEENESVKVFLNFY